MMTRTIETAIAELDVSIFAIQSQTSVDDRRSLLAVHRAVRAWKPSYTYLECGSHIGGSLLPHLLDPCCNLAFSVDKRPMSQPDERGVMFDYPSNSTQRMIAGLALHAPKEEMGKLRTYDVDASRLSSTEISTQPDLVFIDAEHTNEAVFRDFVSLISLCGPSTIYDFHDANLVMPGIQNIETFLRYLKIDFDSFVMRDCVFVLATGSARGAIAELGRTLAIDRRNFIAASQLGLLRANHDAWLAQQARRLPPADALQRRNAPCPCGSGKRYKHCHGSL